jgi:hypothetical protein
MFGAAYMGTAQTPMDEALYYVEKNEDRKIPSITL